MFLFSFDRKIFFLTLLIGVLSVNLTAQQVVLNNPDNSFSNDEDPVYDMLVWSDEFDTAGAINSTKWYHQTLLPNGTSWYNGEIQHYTNRIDNSVVENGVLKIIAKREQYTDQGQTKEFTSARLNSKFAFTYGKVEIRAKLPSGVGTWPALWMLGKNISEPGAYWQTQGFGTTPWPYCGEIDIMEHWGSNQNYVSSATHTPSSFGNTVNVGGVTIPTASTEFHVYSLEWYPERLVFKVDGNNHYTYEPSTLNDDTWPFYKDQYVVFNVAILPEIEAAFTESALEVDYIRVYQETLSLAESGLNELKFYPNPTEDILHVKLNRIPADALEVKVFTIEGRLIRSTETNLTDDTFEIDMSQFQNGFYFMNISTGNQNHVLKVVRE